MRFIKQPRQFDGFFNFFSYHDPDINVSTAAGSKTVLAVGPGPASIVDQVATSYPSFAQEINSLSLNLNKM
jgi:hypothetical protein